MNIPRTTQVCHEFKNKIISMHLGLFCLRGIHLNSSFLTILTLTFKNNLSEVPCSSWYDPLSCLIIWPISSRCLLTGLPAKDMYTFFCILTWYVFISSQAIYLFLSKRSDSDSLN